MASVAVDAVTAGSARVRGRVYGLISALLTWPGSAGVAPRELGRELTGTLRNLPYAFTSVPALAAGDIAELQGEYLRLFELPIDGAVPCGLYGGIYGGNRRSVMEELLRYYRYFGLTVTGANDADLPDSIPTVLEFMQFLCLLEAGADAGESARAAQRDILRRHLTIWAPALQDRLATMNPLPFFAGAVALMDAFCVAELAFLAR